MYFMAEDDYNLQMLFESLLAKSIQGTLIFKFKDDYRSFLWLDLCMRGENVATTFLNVVLHCFYSEKGLSSNAECVLSQKIEHKVMQILSKENNSVKCQSVSSGTNKDSIMFLGCWFYPQNAKG